MSLISPSPPLHRNFSPLSTSVFPKIHHVQILDIAEPSQAQGFPRGIHTVRFLLPSAIPAPKAPAGSEKSSISHLDHPAQPRKTGILWDGSLQDTPQLPWLMMFDPAWTKYPQKDFSGVRNIPGSWSCHCHIRTGAAAPELLHTNPRTQEFQSGWEFPASVSASGTVRERNPSDEIPATAAQIPGKVGAAHPKGVWDEKQKPQ